MPCLTNVGKKDSFSSCYLFLKGDVTIIHRWSNNKGLTCALPKPQTKRKDQVEESRPILSITSAPSQAHLKEDRSKIGINKDDVPGPPVSLLTVPINGAQIFNLQGHHNCLSYKNVPSNSSSRQHLSRFSDASDPPGNGNLNKDSIS